MTTTAHKLYNAPELATVLGVKPGFIRALIRKGFRMPLGVSTPERAHAFLAGLENAIAAAPPTQDSNEETK